MQASPPEPVLGLASGTGGPVSLVRGGPTYDILRRLRVIRHERKDIGRLVLVSLVVGWFPLLAVALVETLVSGTVPQIAREASVHGRLAIAVPLFVLAEPIVDLYVARAGLCLLEGEFVAECRPDFDRLCARASRMRDARVVELILAAVAILDGLSTFGGFGLWHEGARALASSEWSLTKLCFGLLGFPLFVFLFGRWTWRWIIWIVWLAGVSRLRLRLEPAHPDRVGGLVPLAEVSSSFGLVIFALSTVLATSWAPHVFGHGVKFLEYEDDVAVWTFAMLLIAFGPLFLFAPQLRRARLRGQWEYAEMALQFVRAFGARYIDRVPNPDLLESSSLQGMDALEPIHKRVYGVRPVLVGPRELLAVLAATLVPIAPLAASEIPLKGIASHLVRAFLLG